MTTNDAIHRIILLNFTGKEAETIAKAGYNVERGYIGAGNEFTEYLPYKTPHPLYEYDILFYKSGASKELDQEFTDARNGLKDSGFGSAMRSLGMPPYVRVSFIGVESSFNNLIYGGLPFISLIPADENVSDLRETTDKTWEIPELHEVLLRLKTKITTVGQFFRAPPSNGYLWPVPVLRTRIGQVVMGYGTAYDDEEKTPKYIILPQIKDTASAVIQILQCLEKLLPALFANARRTNWLEAQEFLLPEELAVDAAIDEKLREAQSFIAAKQKEKLRLATENYFVRALLTAEENPKLPVEQRLSAVVKSALEFLGFKVEDIDQKIKTAIKKEDFWVTDGNYLAITEVTGTANKNPKVKEFHDILGRMMTLFKRQSELVIPEGAEIFGLLVLNFDLGTHPSKRPIAYIGLDAHIVETAVEQNIGILSTVELHKIVMAVKRNLLNKDAARELIKKPGRVEYKADGGK